MSDSRIYDETVTGEGMTATATPPEVIRYKATREDVIAHLSYLQRGLIRMLWVCLALVQLTWVIPLVAYGAWELDLELVVSILFVILLVILRFARNKQADAMEKRNPDGYSEYTLYDGYLEYRDYDTAGNVVTFYRVTREEVEMPTALPDLYVFRKNGISFSLKRSLVPEGSRFFDIVFPGGVPEPKQSVRLGKERIARPMSTDAAVKLLTVLCAVATLASLLLSDAIGERFWIPLLLLAFPIGLLALVLFVAHKREKVRVLPIVCFLLCGAILLLQSFACAIGSDVQSNRDEVAPYFEAAGIDLPSFSESYTNEESIFDEDTRTFIKTNAFTTYLSEEEADAFYAMIATDTRWLTAKSGALYEELSGFIGEYFDVYLVYNVTENTVNALPATDAVCEYAIFTFTGSYPTLTVTVFEK